MNALDARLNFAAAAALDLSTALNALDARLNFAAAAALEVVADSLGIFAEQVELSCAVVKTRRKRRPSGWKGNAPSEICGKFKFKVKAATPHPNPPALTGMTGLPALDFYLWSFFGATVSETERSVMVVRNDRLHRLERSEDGVRLQFVYADGEPHTVSFARAADCEMMFRAHAESVKFYYLLNDLFWAGVGVCGLVGLAVRISRHIE